MQSIQAALGFPNGTPIDAIQAKVTNVWPRNDIPNGAYGPTSVQNGMIEDAAGNKMKIKVWGHPDIKPLEGKEVVIHAGHGGKGVKVAHDTYTPKGTNTPKTETILDISKAGQFQTVAVYHQNNPSGSPAQGGQVVAMPPKSENPARGSGAPMKAIHGATAGLATNKAVDVLISSGQALVLAREGKLEQAVFVIASQIAKAALRIEAGEEPSIKRAKPVAEEPKAIVAPSPAPEQEKQEEDVPF